MSKVIFDGVGNMPELGRITAKKNYASSSQAHKMGATSAFNDILHYLAEEKYPSLKNEVGGRVAVYQHPVYGFEKKLVEGTTDQYNYNFIGLYTVGADKGDKGYFGFDTKKSTAIRLEGTDHLKGVGFNYPWQVNGVRKIRYNASKEALCIVTGSDSSKWTAILEQSACGNAKTEAEIEAYLEQEFKPAYECAYNNNPLIVGVQMDIDTINGNIDAFNKMRRDDDRQYSYCEFWIDGEYDLYYFDQETLRYEKNGVNLLYQLGIGEDSLAGKSLAEKNKIFIEARVARFKAEAENYFCKDDAIYQLVYLYMIGASDNGEKNMYPYKMDTLANGSRWRFLQDDLDSIFSTDNQGQDTKSYSVELHDFTDDTKSAYVFKGEDSALWQLVELAWPNECKQMGRDILQAMYDLSSKGTKTTDKLMGFFEDYFFARAQEYFTPSAYNNDTEYSYEEAWNNKEYVASVDIHPLAQALGAHLTTERAWVQKRIVYLMSKYGFGGYASNEDTALGIISVRTQTAQGFTLTPAIDSYPTILGGQSQSSSAIERVKAGQPVALAPVGGGNTNTYIVGADFLSDIGDLKGLDIDPNSVVTLSVSSKRLRRLKVGDENPEEVTTNLATLAIQRCDSLETVDARNLTTLVGTVDLSQCPRLTEALFDGTNATAVIIAAGSKIETLHLPNSVSTLDLRDTKFLSDFEIGTLANLRFLRLEGAPIVNGFAMLKEAYNTEGQQLKDIRLVGFEYDGDATDLDMIANLANDLDKDGNEHFYNGIDAQGNPTNGNPILEGKLNIDGYVYEDTANIVKQQYPTIEFTPKGYYMRFADPVVAQICVANFSSDGVGLTEEDAAKVTDLGTIFQGYTEITSFDELSDFGVVELKNNAFKGCTNLKSIDLTKVEKLNDDVFKDCSSLAIDVNMPNLKEFGSYKNTPFTRSGIVAISNLGAITRLPSNHNDGGFAEGCTSLIKVVLPPTCKTIGDGSEIYCMYAFRGCTALREVVGIEQLEFIPQGTFANCTSLDISVLSSLNIRDIRGGAFSGAKVHKIDLPNVRRLEGAFSNCSLSGDINLPSLEVLSGATFFGDDILTVSNLGVATSIGTQCFEANKNLTSVILPSTLQTIGERAFRECEKLPTIDIPSGVTSIGNIAFQNCRLLETVIVRAVTPPTLNSTAFWGTPSTMTIYVPDQSLEAYKTATVWVDYADRIMPMSLYGKEIVTFADPAVEAICKANFDTDGNGYITLDDLEKVTSIDVQFKNQKDIVTFNEFEKFINVKSIVAFGFSECNNLESIRLPQSLEAVESRLFFNCYALKGLSIPNKVRSLGDAVFYNCTSLEMVDIANGSEITSIGERTFLSCSNLKSINLPKGLVSLGSEAFSGCISLTSVSIPKGIKIINMNTFRACKMLTTVEIDEQCVISQIGTSAFVECIKLTSFNLKEGLTSIGDGAFQNCSALTSVDIPSSVTTIGRVCWYGNLSIEHVVCRAVTPPTMGDKVFDATNNCPIYVPDASVEAYKTATNWSTYASRIKPLSEYTE